MMDPWKRFGIIALLFFAVVAEAKDATTCNKRALQNKDCLLRAGKLKVHLFKDKMIVNDSVQRGLGDLPNYQGEGAEWNSVHLRKFGARHFVELEIWTPPEGEVALQSLDWRVYEITDANPTERFQRSLHKRRLLEGDKKSYKYDKTIPHRLYQKKNSVHWKAGRDEGEIPPQRSSHEI